jgi:hypothetical protein
MPLRDHFHPPLANKRAWDELHGAWPTVIVIALNKKLPSRYVAVPQIHLGTFYEIDVASFEENVGIGVETESGAENRGAATAVWAPPQPTLAVTTDLPALDEYEVRVYDTEHERTLVAAIEIVSPANKDRTEHRRLFVTNCAELLRRQVSVSIVDLVTTRQFNLYADLLDLIGQADPSLAPEAPPLYAATCRWRSVGIPPRTVARLETWTHRLALGEPLPILPLWLSEDLAVPLELEASYEETCRALRIA